MKLRVVECSQGFYLEELWWFRWRRCELVPRHTRAYRFYSKNATYPAPYVKTIEESVAWADRYRRDYGKLVVYRV